MIKLYIVQDCDNCNEAKEYFKLKEIEYEEIDMSIGGIKKTIEEKKRFKALGLKTYPIIIINTEKDGELIFPEFDKDSLNNILEKLNE